MALILPADNLRVAFYVGATTDLTLSRLIKGDRRNELKAKRAGQEMSLNRMPSRLNETVRFIRDHASDL
jgi:hypothetical protein